MSDEQKTITLRVTLDREALGRLVREVWIAWAYEQAAPKPSWLVPWEDMAECDRELDRRIGERIAQEALASRSKLTVEQAQEMANEALDRDGAAERRNAVMAALLRVSRGETHRPKPCGS